jgi:D-3-phosphoglycerate dehydrogenase
MKVVVGASSFADSSELPLKMLEEKGIELVKNPLKRRMTEDEIIEHLKGADGLLAGLEPLNEKVFASCPQLKAVARIGIGVENVDFEAAKRHGIKVSNTPDGPTEAVAEMTLTALLTLLHKVIPSNNDVHNGIWKKRIGSSINGLNVLVIGYGHIGRRTATLLESLGANVMIYDKYAENVSTCTLEEGLKAADAVTLHASGKDEVIGVGEIALLKDGAIILNSARGQVINEDALYDALQSGKVAGFWGDALWQEPYEGKIRECENAILTPHICTYTTTCREGMETEAVKNLLRDLGL